MKQVDHTLDLLEGLAARGQITLAEAARELDVSRPTAYRLLSRLQSRGYVDHIRAEHTYRLGPALRVLAANSDISTVARLGTQALADLQATTGETANLAVVRGGHIVYSAIRDGMHALRMSAHVGQEAPPHATALGKAILSMMSAEDRELLLGPGPFRQYTRNTITDPALLEKELAEIRAMGYAIDREEVDVGAVCIAAPIIGSTGEPVAALSVSAVAARFPESQWATVGRAVQRWTDRISRDLGAPAAQFPEKAGSS